mmetsp:Transcript_141860/g.250184  ORF Transcript_141860/g.250184 Transcript_141860/m.250184 type:complete len:335 (-) Transcript_141860:182-1186(-)
MDTMSTASATTAMLTQLCSKIASIVHKLTLIEEQGERDEQRMFFLLNAHTARQDFYQICSTKKGNIRRIIIDSEANIIFDSEEKVKSANNGKLPEFDEIDEKFSHTIPDDATGRDYYRRLRGLQHIPKISEEVPSEVKSKMRHAMRQALENEAKHLRQVIIDNFREQDSRERQTEIDDILARRESREQEQAELHAEKEDLQRNLLALRKQVAEAESSHKRQEEAENELKRTREHDSKRLAWLDRFAPPARSQAHPRTDEVTPPAARSVSPMPRAWTTPAPAPAPTPAPPPAPMATAAVPAAAATSAATARITAPASTSPARPLVSFFDMLKDLD